jgi:prepilin-type N-terminal cleavage/methylation domain-containing protein
VRRPEAGVTLIEVLVAVTLLSLLSMAMLFAMRIGFDAFTKTNDKLMMNRRVAGAQRIIESELEGLIPVMAPCMARPDLQNMTFVLFQGEPEKLRMVSAFSLQQGWHGLPQVLDFFVIAGDNGRGVRLVVNETPYSPMSAGGLCLGIAPDPATGIPGVQFAPATAGPQSFVLADELAYCRFSYLVTPRQTAPGVPPVPTWQPSGTGVGWPRAVRIEMAPLEPDPSRVQPITVTAPIYIHRSTDIQYVDQ